MKTRLALFAFALAAFEPLHAQTSDDLVCYDFIRGQARSTNVSSVEQLGYWTGLLRNDAVADRTPRALRLVGPYRGSIVNPMIPLLNHVLSDGKDLIFTSNDRITDGPFLVDDCVFQIEETLEITDDQPIKGTGRFAGLVHGTMIVSGQIAVDPRIPGREFCPDLVGLTNQFEVVGGALCFEAPPE